jgi:hypothetical protein
MILGLLQAAASDRYPALYENLFSYQMSGLRARGRLLGAERA